MSPRVPRFMREEEEERSGRTAWGRPLEPDVRRRMERALGDDLADVRIHTDAQAQSAVKGHGAEAMAYGNRIAFGPERYQPGTPVGDALLAHELAHTIQQRDGGQPGRAGAVGSRALESDANRSASAAMAGLWGSARSMATGVSAGAAPRLRSGKGLQFFACEPENRIERPSYLGPESNALLDDIENRLDSAEALQYVIVLGTAVNLATSAPQDTLVTEGYDIEPHARALGSVETIVIARIRSLIEQFLVWDTTPHGTIEINQQERQFWERLHERLGNI